MTKMMGWRDLLITSVMLLGALATAQVSQLSGEPVRGSKMFGDKCSSTSECSFQGSTCDPVGGTCQCIEELPITNHINKCGKEAKINESCFFNEQCDTLTLQTECKDGICVCIFEMQAILQPDGTYECHAIRNAVTPVRYVDPAMISILVVMVVMFIIICIVLRLFSKARWGENRTIFNTPNPRLMNVSLLRDSKLLHERRGSRSSVRGPSRQPSMVSLRAHSPNSQGSRRGSRGSSSASVGSLRSNNKNGPSGAALPTSASQTLPGDVIVEVPIKDD